MSSFKRFSIGLMVTIASSSTIVSAANFFTPDNLALYKRGIELNNYIKNKTPYNIYIQQAKSKNAVLTFTADAYKKFPEYQLLVSGVNIEDPKSNFEYKAVGYKAYPFSIMIDNRSNKPINFNPKKITLSLNGQIYPQTNDQDLNILLGKNRSQFWSKMLRTGAALTTVAVSMNTTGGPNIKKAASDSYNNKDIIAIGKKLDDMNDSSEYIMRKSVIVQPNSYAFLYIYFNDFQVKDLKDGAELTLEFEDKSETFIFRTLTFDKFYDLRYSN